MRRLVLVLGLLASLTAPVAAQVAPRPTQGQAAGALPAEIPLFPLQGDSVIGMVRLRPGYEAEYEGRPPVHEVGCAGVIEDYEELADGRYIILLRGLTTFRILSEDQRRPYRLASVEAVPEVLADRDLGTLSAVREELTQLLYSVLPLDAEPPDPGLDDAVYVSVAAQNMPMPEDIRQDLLEQNSVLARAHALVAWLER